MPSESKVFFSSFFSFWFPLYFYIERVHLNWITLLLLLYSFCFPSWPDDRNNLVYFEKRKRERERPPPPNSACWTRHFLLIVFLPPSIEFASEEEFLYVFSSLSGGRKTDVRADEQHDDDDQEKKKKRGRNEIVLANLFILVFTREWKYTLLLFFNSRTVIKKS